MPRRLLLTDYVKELHNYVASCAIAHGSKNTLGDIARTAGLNLPPKIPGPAGPSRAIHSRPVIALAGSTRWDVTTSRPLSALLFPLSGLRHPAGPERSRQTRNYMPDFTDPHLGVCCEGCCGSQSRFGRFTDEVESA
jgi:hypothetical protein